MIEAPMYVPTISGVELVWLGVILSAVTVATCVLVVIAIDAEFSRWRRRRAESGQVGAVGDE